MAPDNWCEQPAVQAEAQPVGGDLAPDVVHAAAGMLGKIGRGEALVDLLRRYLGQPLLPDEEAWARWELVDQLAVQSRCEEATEAQRDFLSWARRALATDRLLWVMNDGTQALCWFALGHDEWFAIRDDLMDQTVNTEANRLGRLYYIRTAGRLLIELGSFDETLALADEMQRVADEDPEWERAFWACVESRVLQLNVHQVQDNRNALQSAATAIIMRLDHQYSLLQLGEDADTDTALLHSLYHNTAAVLYRANEYELAAPIAERSIELNVMRFQRGPTAITHVPNPFGQHG